MAEAKKPAAKTAPDAPKVASADEAYFGERQARHPDEAYSLVTGPDSPTGENGPE